MKKISIIKIGNYLALKNAFLNIDYPFDLSISTEYNVLNRSDLIVIPGVGNFGGHMNTIRNFNIDILLKESFHKLKPIIGVCAGMHIFFESSEEDCQKGLGLLKGRVEKLSNFHNEWTFTAFQDSQKSNLNGSYYYNHQFAFLSSKYSLANCIFENNSINSIIKSNNFYGIQFHPEKSQRMGNRIIKEIVKTALKL